jgi:hypothetical protein
MNFPTQAQIRKNRGFALPMVVMALAGMMILLIGLLAMLTLERKTARAYSDATRAEMALESGLADAIATISPVASRDDSIVFRIDDPTTPVIAATTSQPAREQFFTFGASYDTGKNSWRVLPFVSGIKELSGGANAIDTTALRTQLSTFTPETLTSLNQYDSNVPRAKWVDVIPTDSNHTLRYAWWVEDLGGRIDGAQAGAEPRAQALSPRELNYYTVFNSTSDTVVAGPQDKLIAEREKLRSAASARLILGPADAKKIEPYLTYQLPKSVKQVPLIPHGFGYADAGKPAPNLTDLIDAKNVDEIAAHIDRNLPNFQARKGGFPASENYTKTIAASIIDYADADSNATIGTGYRGVDSYPFVNEIFDRYEWIQSNNPNQVTIRVTTFIELWNPSNQKLSAFYQLENLNRHKIKIPPSGTFTLNDVKLPLRTITLLPNEFKVIDSGFKDYFFPVVFQPSTLYFPEKTTDSSYRLYWNGRVVDWARGGVTREGNPNESQTLLSGSHNRKWKGNASPAHDHSIGQHGDPRASYYINAPIFPNNYNENSNWGGRALKPTITNTNYREVKITRWPDRGPESTAGKVPGSDATLPTTLAYPANQPNMAPAFIANRPLVNLAELGNIFDPAQWSAVETLGTASNSSGGGITLAIGRPEYAVFDKEGQRAAQLLDLFTLPQNASITQSSRVNLNTAPREVLRTLLAGQALTNDPNQGTLYPPKDINVGDRFADAVIATRNRTPLRSLSDLNLVRKNPAAARNYANPNADTEPFFGSAIQYPAGKRPPEAWDDAGREELFQRVSNLVTFQSKTFRIVVAGQVLDKSGTVVGRRTREFTVEISPPRDATGAIIANQPLLIRTLSERSL